jgi:hypothetical protein
MMPIEMKFWQWEASIPESLRAYKPLIRQCFHYQGYGLGKNKVAYLTVHESIVEPNESQRRPGVHIDSPLQASGSGKVIEKPDHIRGPLLYEGEPYDDVNVWRALNWGGGHYRTDLAFEGIYLASNVDDMCQVWGNRIIDSEKITDESGGLEHARHLLVGEPIKLKANTLHWITDKTPHESLPNLTDKPIYRQFFRLVVGPIGVWYSKHNTENPLGVKPEAPISDQDKFKNKCVFCKDELDRARAIDFAVCHRYGRR